MASRKRAVKESDKNSPRRDIEDRSIDNPPSTTIAPLLSQHDTQALIMAFANTDDHAGIATLSMQDDSITFPPARKICHDLLAYSALETSLTLQPYWNMHCITRATVGRWRADPYFRNCHDIAKERIGVRREQRFLNDPGRMYASMPIYSADYRELKEWETELSNKKADQPTNITIKVDRSSGNEHNSGQTDRRDMPSPVGDKTTAGETGDEPDGTQEP